MNNKLGVMTALISVLASLASARADDKAEYTKPVQVYSVSNIMVGGLCSATLTTPDAVYVGRTNCGYLQTGATIYAKEFNGKAFKVLITKRDGKTRELWYYVDIQRVP